MPKITLVAKIMIWFLGFEKKENVSKSITKLSHN